MWAHHSIRIRRFGVFFHACQAVKQRAKEAIAQVERGKEKKSHGDSNSDKESEYAEHIADYVKGLESREDANRAFQVVKGNMRS